METPSLAMLHSAKTDRRSAAQPLAALQLDDALLKKATVSAVTGLSASSVDRKTKEGLFPKPIKLGTRCTRWRAIDVRQWLAAQAAGHQA